MAKKDLFEPYQPPRRREEPLIAIPRRGRNEPAKSGATNQPQFSFDAEAELEMLELVNRERRNRRLKPLTSLRELQETARNYASEMARRGFFSHTSPDGNTLGNRLARRNIMYSMAGENLALAPDVQKAHTGLMASSSHRANILNPQFENIGIGASVRTQNGIYVVEVFTANR